MKLEGGFCNFTLFFFLVVREWRGETPQAAPATPSCRPGRERNIQGRRSRYVVVFDSFLFQHARKKKESINRERESERRICDGRVMGEEKRASSAMGSRERGRDLLIPVAEDPADDYDFKASASSSAATHHHSGREVWPNNTFILFGSSFTVYFGCKLESCVVSSLSWGATRGLFSIFFFFLI